METDRTSLLDRNKVLQEKNKKLNQEQKDAVEKLEKLQADMDKQLVQCMQQIKGLAAERDLQAQELVDLRTAAQAVAEMVEDGDASGKSLVERLCEVPQKITGFVSDTSKQYMAHVMGLVKSYWPGGNLTPIGDGLAEGCSEEKFAEYIEEVKPLANKIVDSLDQSLEGDA